MSRCSKCNKEQMIMLKLEGKSYCIDCLKNLILDEGFLKQLLEKKNPDRDWDKIRINIK